ncbi:hypothetical protein [Pelomonas sp. SE-A7]|uniref:hypothetical protein n=1 Tax=Pelomonas sp. SE-A7 TaxID=3054953 RepID=UPI00259CA582|nr:hypothetical protein [Pelomonas sp. SE-A7]MDM4766714.1 hypothetical protein [Pelomonas sp. SE-A7]
MQARQAVAGAIAPIVVALLTACGGGGGGSSGNGGAPTPAPVQTQLAITSGNYVGVAQQALAASDFVANSGGMVVAAETVDTNLALRQGLALRDRLSGWFKSAPVLAAGAETRQVVLCGTSGSMELTVTDKNGNNDFDAGDSVSIKATACVEAGVRMDGGLSFAATSMTGNFASASYTAGMVLTFSDFSASSGNVGVTGNGQMNLKIVSASPFDNELTIDIPSFSSTVRIAGQTYSQAFSNFHMVVTTKLVGSDFTASTSASGQLSGSGFDNKSISVDTPTPFKRRVNEANPTSGQILIRGSGGSQLRATAQANGTMVLLELDADGNGAFETSVSKPWSELH